MRLHNPNAHPVTRLVGEAVVASPAPPRSVSRGALVRANLTTTAAKIALGIAAVGVAMVAAVFLVDDDGSGRIGGLVTAVVLLAIGGLLVFALPLRLAASAARLSAVRARVTEVSYDAVSRDTIESMASGMARGVAVVEPHPDGDHQPQPEERRFEVDEGWASQIAPGTTLIALERPGNRLLIALGIDAEVSSVDGV